jgi:hypothetical protein
LLEPVAFIFVGRLSESALVEGNDMSFQIFEGFHGRVPDVRARGVAMDEEERGFLPQPFWIELSIEEFFAICQLRGSLFH